MQKLLTFPNQYDTMLSKFGKPNLNLTKGGTNLQCFLIIQNCWVGCGSTGSLKKVYLRR